MADAKKQEIEKIIKHAKHIKVSMYKNKLHGRDDDKFVVYMVYKIGELEVSDNLVSYKGEIFPDSTITSMVKKRANELNPEIMAKCRREAEKWTRVSHKIAKDYEK